MCKTGYETRYINMIIFLSLLESANLSLSDVDKLVEDHRANLSKVSAKGMHESTLFKRTDLSGKCVALWKHF